MHQTRIQLRGPPIKMGSWTHSIKKNNSSNIRFLSLWTKTRNLIISIRVRFRAFKGVYCPLQVLAGNTLWTLILDNLYLLAARISKMWKTLNLYCLKIIRTRQRYRLLSSKIYVILIILQEDKVLIQLIKNHLLMILIWLKTLQINTKCSRIRITKLPKNSIRNFIIKKIRRTWKTLILL